MDGSSSRFPRAAIRLCVLSVSETCGRTRNARSLDDNRGVFLPSFLAPCGDRSARCLAIPNVKLECRPAANSHAMVTHSRLSGGDERKAVRVARSQRMKYDTTRAHVSGSRGAMLLSQQTRWLFPLKRVYGW